MKTLSISRIGCKALSSLLALAVTVSTANVLAETDDNAPPGKDIQFYGDVRMLSAASPAWVGASLESIASTADVDYIILACGSNNTARQASISLNSAAGDLDMDVYGLEGTLLAFSRGTTRFEAADLTAIGRSIVVLKVYGYRGATGTYQAGLSCG